MKKLIVFAAAAAFAMIASAAENTELNDVDFDDEEVNDEESLNVVVEPPKKEVGVWPAFFAVCEIPSVEQAPDVIGLRVTIPYSTKHESVTGFDIGLWGRTMKFEGFMLNLLRNDVKDQLSGFQVGLYNTAVQADQIGLQIGLWNEANSITGVQVGLVNATASIAGIQVGIINRSEDMYGIQVGVVNVIRSADYRFMPLVNIGFR